MSVRRHCIPFLIFLTTSGLGQSYLTNFHPDSLRFKTATAVRCFETPVIDGILDEAVWQSALPVDEFFQTNPLELTPPSEKTIVRILYDDNSLYISFQNYDSQPDKIKRPLTRRDIWMEGFNSNADWVGLSIDSQNNDLNGYFIAVNAAGIKIDVIISGQQGYDNSWDAVWDVAVNMNDEGWSAEFQIPFAIFQFKNSEVITWGIEFERHIHRLQEQNMWPGRRKSAQGIVYSLGVLNGLKDIPAQKQLEVLPYTLIGRGKQKNQFDVGVDARYGLSSSSVFNLTFNPDFGQVEADPSVLNLTAFETFYEEKRPFFSEGADFFNQRLQLFHSRRIGKSPDYLLPEDGEIENVPKNTTILGAVKLMGNTASGLNYGVIEAVTSEERATWITDSSRSQLIIEPQTNYFIGRLETPVINDISWVGLMVTDVARLKYPGATVTGLDWKLNFLDNRLFSTGQVIHSSTNGTSGNAFRFNAGYTDPVWWSVRFWYGYYDDTFDVNDLGFLRRNNINWAGGRIELRKQEPWGKFLNNDFELKFMRKWRGDGLILEREIEIEQNNMLSNYWRLGYFSKLLFTAFNDEDIFRNEKSWTYKTELFGYGGAIISTDRRKKLVLSMEAGAGYAKLRGRGYRLGLGVEIKPIEPLNIEIKTNQDLSPTYMQWVDIIETPEDTVRVYANSKQVTKDITLRLNWTFSPDLTLQCFMQPFYADMNYEKFFQLLTPNTMDLETYDYLAQAENPDFTINNTVGTIVLRWQYRPGSTFYLVYNLNESRFYSPVDEAWTLEGSNAIFVKLNYWLKN